MLMIHDDRKCLLNVARICNVTLLIASRITHTNMSILTRRDAAWVRQLSFFANYIFAFNGLEQPVCSEHDKRI